MKSLCLLIFIILFVSCSHYNTIDSKSDTGLGTSPFSVGGQFAHGDANAMNDSINENSGRIDDIEAVNGVVKMSSGTPSAAVPGVDFQGKMSWAEGETYTSLQIVEHDGTFYTCRDGFGHTATTDDEPGVGVNWETYWYAHTTTSQYADKVTEGDTSVETTDTGTDGEVTITADGVEIMSITSSGIIMPIITADSSIAVDDTASPVVVKTVTVGETVGMWQPVKYVVAQGEYMLADANASGLWPADCISIGDTSDDAGSSAADGEDILCMVMGYGYNTEWTVSDGARICLSETAGNLVDCSSLVWDAENDCAQEVGKVDGTDRIWFDFSKPELVHAAP